MWVDMSYISRGEYARDARIIEHRNDMWRQRVATMHREEEVSAQFNKIKAEKDALARQVREEREQLDAANRRVLELEAAIALHQKPTADPPSD